MKSGGPDNASQGAEVSPGNGSQVRRQSGSKGKEDIRSSHNEREDVASRRSSAGGQPPITRKTIGMSSNTQVQDTSSLFVVSQNDDLPSQMTSQRSKKKTKSTREIKFRLKSKGQKSSERSEVMKNYDAEK